MSEKPKINYNIEREMTIDKDGNEVVDIWATISGLFVPKDLRGMGYARKLLRNAIHAIETKHPHIEIFLNAEPYEEEDSVDLKRLCDFYESEGFVLQGPIESGVLMKREK